MAKAPNAEKQSMPKSGRGGARPGSGRPPGSKSEKTLELEAAARKYAGDAFEALVDIARNGESEAARVSAATAILDRGYGKPRQSIGLSGEDGGPIQVQVWKFGTREVTF